MSQIFEYCVSVFFLQVFFELVTTNKYSYLSSFMEWIIGLRLQPLPDVSVTVSVQVTFSSLHCKNGGARTTPRCHHSWCSDSTGPLTLRHSSTRRCCLRHTRSSLRTQYIVVDEEHVHLLLDFPRGSEVLRLSTEEYFRRVLEKQEQGKLAIKCLRNRVEDLNKQLTAQKQLLSKEKKEAVSAVREFWRDNVIKGGSWGGWGDGQSCIEES